MSKIRVFETDRQSYIFQNIIREYKENHCPGADCNAWQL